jgi:DnaJ-domain-containing protein 1
MPADFLMEQMEWREAVMDARNGGDHHELDACTIACVPTSRAV